MKTSVSRASLAVTLVAISSVATTGALTAMATAPGTVPPIGEPVGLVLVDKSDRELRLLSLDETRILARFPAAFGDDPIGHKEREGDERTPEGRYTLDWRNPRSGYHLSIHVSYPNAADVAAAEARGESPGGMIMIHGQPNGFGWLAPILQMRDWTDGCIALSNAHMDVVWEHVPNGTPIIIRP